MSRINDRSDRLSLLLRILAVLVVGALLATACASNGGDGAATEDAGDDGANEDVAPAEEDPEDASDEPEGEADDAAGEPAADAEVLQIGGVNSETGNFVPFTTPAVDGAKLAIQRINESGGFEVDGTTYTMEFINIDDRSEEAAAIAGMLELVEDRGINIVFGPQISALAQQVEDILVSNDVLYLTASDYGGEPVFSDPDLPLFFGGQIPLEQRASLLADGFADLGVESVGLMAADDPTGNAVLPSFRAAFEEVDIELIEVLFPFEVSDLTPFMTRMAAEDPDALFFFYPQNRFAEALRLARDLDVANEAYAVWNANTTIFTEEELGGALDKILYSPQITPSLAFPPSQEIEQFKQDLLALDPNFPETSGNFAFFYFDLVYMLVEAMQDAGTVTDTIAIADALQDVQIDGLAGTVCIADDERRIQYDTAQLFLEPGTDEPRVETFPSPCNEQ